MSDEIERITEVKEINIKNHNKLKEIQDDLVERLSQTLQYKTTDGHSYEGVKQALEHQANIDFDTIAYGSDKLDSLKVEDIKSWLYRNKEVVIKFLINI